MIRKLKNTPPKVFFNASVILAGLRSPRGGSALVMSWSKKGKIKGIVSEIVLDEVHRHANKLKISKTKLEQLPDYFQITPAPKKLSSKYKKMVLDIGDVHLFVSCQHSSVNYLVSLDKKHVLSLANTIKAFKIASPGELIKELAYT